MVIYTAMMSLEFLEVYDSVVCNINRDSQSVTLFCLVSGRELAQGHLFLGYSDCLFSTMLTFCPLCLKLNFSLTYRHI